MEHHQADAWCAGRGCKGTLRYSEATGCAKPVVEREARGPGSLATFPTPGGAGDDLTLVKFRPAAG